jgi:hypothetical protein
MARGPIHASPKSARYVRLWRLGDSQEGLASGYYGFGENFWTRLPLLTSAV